MSVKQKVTVKIILDVTEISQIDFRKLCWTNETHFFHTADESTFIPDIFQSEVTIKSLLGTTDRPEQEF